MCDSAHSQVPEAFKVDHRGRDFTIQVVAGEVEFPEPPKPANLWRDCPGYVVFLQQTVDTDGYN